MMQTPPSQPTDTASRALAPAGVRIAATTLQDYARSASARWADYERHIGEPMQKWALAELPQTKGIVFYPFSGPDFATVYHLYPGAERYVLVALQRAQPMPAFDKASAAEIASFMSRFGEAWKQFAQIGFFRTNDLDDDAKQAGIRIGITAPLTAFAVRTGFRIVAVAPMRINAEGTDLEAHPGKPEHGAEAFGAESAGLVEVPRGFHQREHAGGD